MWLAEFGMSLDAADEWAKEPALPWRRPSPATPDQEDGPRPGRLRRIMLLVMSVVAAASLRSAAVHADEAQVARGKYLVQFGGCNDCHTAGYLLGKPDASRYLGGSDVGFDIPGLGVFVGANLTPDKETGLGNWTTAEIVTAIQTGVRPDGRQLAPIMPWRAFASLKKSDAVAIATYLKTLPPVTHKVAGPFGPSEQPTTFVMKLSSPASPGAPLVSPE